MIPFSLIFLTSFLIFVLQGPHIASVTLAAYECNSVNFPEPPYPDQIICPDEEGIEGSVSLWSIISKVRIEACMWVRYLFLYLSTVNLPV